MAQFMLLLVEEPPDFSKFTPEGIQQLIAEYSGWRSKVGATGKLTGGNKLRDEGGKHLSGMGDDFRVTDGPFAEAKEVLGGYFMIEAANYDEAVEISRDCPHLKYGTRIELREVEPT